MKAKRAGKAKHAGPAKPVGPTKPAGKPQRTDARTGVEWAKARKVLAKHRSRLLRRKGVIGVDLGIKRRDGRLVPGPCLRVHVERKISLDALRSARVLPRRLEGVPIDVVQTVFRTSSCPIAASRHRKLLNPLQGGCSIGRFGQSVFGTLGALALNSDGSPGGLTCAHVCRKGVRVVQPHRTGRVIGNVLLEVDATDVDASFVLLSEDQQWRDAVLNYGEVLADPLDIGPEDLPVTVELVGGCSGRTEGKVVSTNFDGKVVTPDGHKFVRGQLCIECSGPDVFARTGYSGGSVLKSRRLVGLLIAAGQEESGGTGLATPMSRALDRLNVRLP